MFPSNNADMPVSLENRQGDVTDVPDVPVQPEVLKQVMFAQAVAPGECLVQLAVTDDDIAAPLDEKTKRVRSAGPVRERPVQHHETLPSFSRMVQSITAVTGAMVGATAAAGYLVGVAVFALPFGRPLQDPVADFASAAVLLVALGTVYGAVAGLIVRVVTVRRSEHAGRTDWRLVRRGLAVILALSSVLGIRNSWIYEAANWVRVVQTSPAIARMEGSSKLAPITPAVVVFELFGNVHAQMLMWKSAPVTVSQIRQIVTIRRGDRVVDTINARRMEYLTEIIATTATLDGTAEWLALLIRLQPDARRDLLLIYDPSDVLVHKEMFERTATGAGTVLWTAGAPRTRQELAIDVGSPVRFAAVDKTPR
jgi:hypothetical protein